MLEKARTYKLYSRDVGAARHIIRKAHGSKALKYIHPEDGYYLKDESWWTSPERVKMWQRVQACYNCEELRKLSSTWRILRLFIPGLECFRLEF